MQKYKLFPNWQNIFYYFILGYYIRVCYIYNTRIPIGLLLIGKNTIFPILAGEKVTINALGT